MYRAREPLGDKICVDVLEIVECYYDHAISKRSLIIEPRTPQLPRRLELCTSAPNIHPTKSF